MISKQHNNSYRCLLLCSLYMWCVLTLNGAKSGIFWWCSKYVVSAAFLFFLKRQHIWLELLRSVSRCVFCNYCLNGSKIFWWKVLQIIKHLSWISRWKIQRRWKLASCDCRYHTISDQYVKFLTKSKTFWKYTYRWICSKREFFLLNILEEINYSSSGNSLRFVNEYSWRFDFNFNRIFIGLNDRQQMPVSAAWTMDNYTKKRAPHWYKVISAQILYLRSWARFIFKENRSHVTIAGYLQYLNILKIESR